MYEANIFRGRLIALAAALAVSAWGAICHAEETTPETDGEIWNRGVDLYRDGNFTNALSVLKPLILSKTHGVRASELAGAIEFAEGLKRGGEGAAKPLASLENAAADFQLALRSNPADPRLNRNFTRATDRIPQLREQAHVEKVVKELGQQDPGALLGSGVKDIRSLLKDFPAAFTNDAKRTVALCDMMVKRAERLSDIWIAVKAGVAQSVTNEQQAMTINMQVEEARAATEAAATGISDIAPEAMEPLKKAENSFTRFWKLAILPPAACDESMLAQTNKLLMTENEYGRDWQQEALEFTQAFRAKFPMWAQAYEQQAQAEISALSTDVEKIQLELVKAKSDDVKGDRKGGGKAAEKAAKQFNALKKLARIKELLPKDNNGGGGHNQNRNQDQNQDKEQNKNDNKDKDRQESQNQNTDSQQNQNQEQPQDDKEQEEKESATKDQQQNKNDDQVEDILRRAQERSDQHDADKKARMNKAPLPSNERDW